MKINKLIIAIALLFIYGGAFAQHNHEHHHHDLEHHHDLGYIEGTVYEEIEGKKLRFQASMFIGKSSTKAP